MSTLPLREILWKQQKGLCYLCHEPMIFELRPPHPLGLTVDHIVPRASRGSTKQHNKLLAHLDCNAAKANKQPPMLSRGVKLRDFRTHALGLLNVIHAQRSQL
jgi:5-methylcytosine-specific restriction endonuclease McrA